MATLMRCEAPAMRARRHSKVRAADSEHARPAVGPSMTHSKAPTGSAIR